MINLNFLNNTVALTTIIKTTFIFFMVQSLNSIILITDLLFIFLFLYLFPEIYGDLFQTILSFKFPLSWVFGSSKKEEFEILLSIFVPIMIYNNVDTDKSKILADLKGKAGIYVWSHKDTGKMYVGSSINLSKRMHLYYSIKILTRYKTIYIYNALLHHGYSAFTLTIYEFINISNLSLEETKKLILKFEQIYIDTLKPEYNINPIAGSRLGSKHTKESLIKMSGENHHMIRITDYNHPKGMLGKKHSAQSIAKLCETLKNIDRTGVNNPMFGKIPSIETRAKISASRGTTIYVYNINGTLVNTFSSARKAALHFNVDKNTIISNVKNNKLFQEKWILSLSVK